MEYAQYLDIAANIAAILTAVIATWAFGHFQAQRRSKRLRLEAFLRDEYGTGHDGGQRSVLELVAQLGMSEAEIIDAAFRSKVVTRKVSNDELGREDRLFLRYKTDEDCLLRPGRAQF